MIDTLARELSQKVSELYGIEAYNSSKTVTVAGRTFDLPDNWLHQDSGRCFDLALKHGIHYFEFPNTGINPKICTNTMDENGKGAVEVLIEGNKQQAARTAILLAMLALKGHL